MSFKITGKVFWVSEKMTRGEFTFREITITATENGEPRNYFLQLAGRNIDLLSENDGGKDVEVSFAIDCKAGSKDGRPWKMTSLRAYRIDFVQKSRAQAEPTTPPPPTMPSFTDVSESMYGAPAPAAVALPPVKYKKNEDGTLQTDETGNPILDDDLPF